MFKLHLFYEDIFLKMGSKGPQKMAFSYCTPPTIIAPYRLLAGLVAAQGYQNPHGSPTFGNSNVHGGSGSRGQSGSPLRRHNLQGDRNVNTPGGNSELSRGGGDRNMMVGNNNSTTDSFNKNYIYTRTTIKIILILP